MVCWRKRHALLLAGFFFVVAIIAGLILILLPRHGPVVVVHVVILARTSGWFLLKPTAGVVLPNDTVTLGVDGRAEIPDNGPGPYQFSFARSNGDPLFDTLSMPTGQQMPENVDLVTVEEVDPAWTFFVGLESEYRLTRGDIRYGLREAPMKKR